MTAFIASLVCAACVAAAPDSSEGSAGYLFHPARCLDGSVCLETRAYIPQEGDIIICASRNHLWQICFSLARSGPPFHAAVVIREPNGRLAVLEAGPNDTWCVYILPLPERLAAYPGRIWVRQLKVPLTPEESARLTNFATDQTGKGFAFGRVLFAATFRPAPNCGKLFGRTCLDRPRWFCSELVVAACVVAGRMDPKIVSANCIYPRDLFLDRSVDFSSTWDMPLLWSEHPSSGLPASVIEQLEPVEKEMLDEELVQR
jgi:hypothetical protein